MTEIISTHYPISLFFSSSFDVDNGPVPGVPGGHRGGVGASGDHLFEGFSPGLVLQNLPSQRRESFLYKVTDEQRIRPQNDIALSMAYIGLYEKVDAVPFCTQRLIKLPFPCCEKIKCRFRQKW